MNESVRIYQNYIDDLKDFSLREDESRFVAKQLLELHSEVSQRNKVVVLELGVDRGQSTKVFLNAIDGKPSSHLVSVDIRDCGGISKSKMWTFVRGDSANVSGVVHAAPVLKSGIDVIYVDSLHTAEHVRKEIVGYFPYLKKGGVIFFDDIDSDPYLMGQRKDSLGTEIANRKIFELIEAVFRANRDKVNWVVFHGSTGLARLEKISDMNSILNEPLYIKKRKNKLFWRIFYLITRRRQYQHNLNTNDSFLIDVTKYYE